MKKTDFTFKDGQMIRIVVSNVGFVVAFIAVRVLRNIMSQSVSVLIAIALWYIILSLGLTGLLKTSIFNKQGSYYEEDGMVVIDCAGKVFKVSNVNNIFLSTLTPAKTVALNIQYKEGVCNLISDNLSGEEDIVGSELYGLLELIVKNDPMLKRVESSEKDIFIQYNAE